MNRITLYLGLTGLAWIALINQVHAQAVVPDGTLNTIVNSTNNRDFAIVGGTIAGSNLFHSFREFSVPTGGSAQFNNAANIQTIFSRVTGGTVSRIDGLLQTNGSASLFLLNPSGILFGANASLNIGGSFVGTTATRIKFADGAEFSAVNPPTQPLLTMSAPIGLQFGASPAAIQVQGNSPAPTPQNFFPIQPSTPSGLQVRPEQTLALIGGDVTLDGGEIGAVGGRVELGSVGTAATLSAIATADGFTFDYRDVPTLGHIQLANGAFIHIGSGNAQIQGQSVRLTEGSVIAAQNFGTRSGGSLLIRGTERVQLSSESSNRRSAILSDVFNTGAGNDLNIVTQQLVLNDRSTLLTRSFASGVSGNLRIDATKSVTVQGVRPDDPTQPSAIASASFADGKAGDILVNTPHLLLRDAGVITSTNLGTGTGGEVQVNTQITEIVGNDSDLYSSSISSFNIGTGAAGSVNLMTDQLYITRLGAIQTSSLNDGSAGDITVRASEKIVVSGRNPDGSVVSTIESAVFTADPLLQRLLNLPDIPKGQAGNIRITTPDLSLTHGAYVSVGNFAEGNAGNITLTVDTLKLDSAALQASTKTGTGGNIVINARLVQLRHLSQITTNAQGQGNGGNITINSPVILGLDNSDIVANAVDGSGGNIAITTQGLFGLKYRSRLTPESDITASSQFGVNGTVDIDRFGVNPDAALIQLPNQLIDPNQKLAAGCAEPQGNRFIVSGRGGIPDNPTQASRSDRAWSDVRNLPRSTQAPVSQSSLPVLEATGWRRNSITGTIDLIAAQPMRSNQAVTCTGSR